jgi:hypothetical protein
MLIVKTAQCQNTVNEYLGIVEGDDEINTYVRKKQKQ